MATDLAISVTGLTRRFGARVAVQSLDLRVPAGTMYGVPVTCANGKYERVTGLEIDAFSREKMDATLQELTEERDGVKHLLGK